MDVYVARQPIFDRHMNVIAYELLYRKSMNNFYEGTDDNQATAELINNAFLTMHYRELTGGTKAFINFSEDMLINEIPLLLPPESTVVEILERVEINDSLISSSEKLRDNGYIIALDDFVFDESYLPLLDIAHIIKIEFPVVSLESQRKLIKKYKNKIKFLAEKVETREEYQLAYDMGYDYFQGYFFSKPVIVKSKEIGSLNVNLTRVMDQLNKTEPDYQKIADIIETDLGLSYKLLKLANSVFFGVKNKIIYTKQALVQLGIIELKKWIYLMMLQDIQVIENKELIKTCFIRAKFMELIAAEVGGENKEFEYFMVGLLSSIDVLMNRDMESIVKELTLTPSVRDALLGVDNEIRKILDVIIFHENLKPENLYLDEIHTGLDKEKFIGLYIESLMWVLQLDY